MTSHLFKIRRHVPDRIWKKNNHDGGGHHFDNESDQSELFSQLRAWFTKIDRGVPIGVRYLGISPHHRVSCVFRHFNVQNQH